MVSVLQPSLFVNIQNLNDYMVSISLLPKMKYQHEKKSYLTFCN